MAKVDGECLRGQEMYRDRIARERIDRQHVEPLRRLALERQAGVAEHDLDLRRRVREIRELVSRELDHLRVDLVDAERVARAALRSEPAGTETDHPDPHRA